MTKPGIMFLLPYTLREKWAFGKVCVTAKAKAVHLGLTIKILN